VQTAYERADVDFADQYGSQTNRLANGDFGNSGSGWSQDGGWTFNTGQGVASGTNSFSLFQPTTILETVGAYTYKYSFDYNRTSGSSTLTFRYYTGSAWVTIVDKTDASGTASGEFTVTGGATNGGIYFYANGTWAGTVDNVVLQRVGCVSDYDLAFANPTQSLTVQDRAGAADGTCSASGVTQVQPVVQGNLTSLAVSSGTARTPADGAITADDVLVNTDTHFTTGGTPKVSINTTANALSFGFSDEIAYIRKHGSGAIFQWQTSDSGSNAGEIQLQPYGGDLLVGAADLNANVGAKKMQFEGSASTAVGPEMLLHNPAQGGGAASMLTFGGKASGTEGYTAAIKATNTGTLTIGTSSASGGFSEPAADLTIDSTGLTTAKDLLVADGSNDVAVALGNSGYGMALDFSSGELSLKTNTVPRLTVSNLGLATFSGDTKIGDGLVSNYVKHVAGLDDTVAISFTFPSQGTRWINHLIELRVAMGDDSTTTAFPTFLRYAIASLTSINGITQMDASLGSGITVGTSSSGTTFTVTLTEGSAISMDSVTVFATATAGHGDAKCTGMTVA
jgi:hypothetical protein